MSDLGNTIPPEKEPINPLGSIDEMEAAGGIEALWRLAGRITGVLFFPSDFLHKILGVDKEGGAWIIEQLNLKRNAIDEILDPDGSDHTRGPHDARGDIKKAA